MLQELKELREKLAAAEKKADEAHQRAEKHEQELKEGMCACVKTQNKDGHIGFHQNPQNDVSTGPKEAR